MRCLCAGAAGLSSLKMVKTVIHTTQTMGNFATGFMGVCLGEILN